MRMWMKVHTCEEPVFVCIRFVNLCHCHYMNQSEFNMARSRAHSWWLWAAIFGDQRARRMPSATCDWVVEKKGPWHEVISIKQIVGHVVHFDTLTDTQSNFAGWKKVKFWAHDIEPIHCSCCLFVSASLVESNGVSSCNRVWPWPRRLVWAMSFMEVSLQTSWFSCLCRSSEI